MVVLATWIVKKYDGNTDYSFLYVQCVTDWFQGMLIINILVSDNIHPTLLSLRI